MRNVRGPFIPVVLVLALSVNCYEKNNSGPSSTGGGGAGGGEPQGGSAAQTGGALGSGGGGGAVDTGGAGTDVPCNQDAVCEEEEQASQNPCSCSDCAGTSLCVPDQCVNDGLCDLKDACVCAECYDDPNCGVTACKNDGYCDSAREGCLCDDCASHELCSTGAGGAGGA